MGLTVPSALIPEADFPVPLLQSVTAMKHLLARGVKPSNLILTGDSAGANLVVQVLLHAIHPLAGLPTVEGLKFAGAYLMSPWLSILPRENKCYQENAMWDIISPAKISDFGTAVLSGIKDHNHLPYIDTYVAPSDWYDDMGAVVKRVLITAGRRECFRDDIIKFGKRLETVNGMDVKLVVDKNGVHDDPFFDFTVGEKQPGELTGVVVSWCLDVFV